MSLDFSALNLSAPLLKAIADEGYETPSPIQAGAIPPLLAGRDILGQAQTGTGKTAAFALPLLMRLNFNTTERAPQVLVLAPTRELAIQVAEAFKSYARYLENFAVLPIYGGAGYQQQLAMLRKGVQVVVGTPGRIIDHIERGTLSLANIQTLVLDEADEMLRMGFLEDVELILQKAPPTRQIALFSATMPPQIRKVTENYLNNPEVVRIKTATTTNANIEQSYLLINGHYKMEALTRLLEAKTFDAALIFVRTKNATQEVAEKLAARGYSCAPLNGDIVQKQRERTINQLKNGSLDIVVATDVAARGIDVERVSLVINYDIPYDAEAYTHRIGRTGRAGRAGEAILFITKREQRMLKTIERTTSSPISAAVLPSIAEINAVRSAKFIAKLDQVAKNAHLLAYRQLIDEYQQATGNDIYDIAAALAKIAQGELPLFADDEELIFSHEEPREPRARREREPRERRERAPRQRVGQAPQGMRRFYIAVGKDHGVRPGNIVGAIANEGNLESRAIGPIEIFAQFSTVDLPENIPNSVLATLKNAWVCQQRLNIRPFEGDLPSDEFSARTVRVRKAKKPEPTAPEKKPRKKPKKRTNKDKGKPKRRER